MNLIEKIEEAMAQIKPHPQKIVVGVSGGADSICQAMALKELDYTIIIAHLNHSLRGKASDEDETFVKQFAEQLKVPYETRKVSLPKKGNLEALGREARYDFLEDISDKYQANHIAVAHHENDQIETILMNIHRGAGLRGARGMQLESENIIRPMLKIRKSEILDFLESKKQPYRHDKSNDDQRYLRNRIRHFVIPEFKEKDPFFETHLLNESERARGQLILIEQTAEEWRQKEIKNSRFNRERFRLLKTPVKTEVIIQLFGKKDLYRKNIHQLTQFIESGKTGKQMTKKNVTLVIEYDEIKIVKYNEIRPSKGREPSAQQKPEKKKITKAGIRWFDWEIKSSAKTAVYVRSWKKGDSFQPNGMKGSKKLQDFFVDQKIPKNERQEVPIIVDEADMILSIGTLRLSKKGLAIKDKLTIDKIKN